MERNEMASALALLLLAGVGFAGNGAPVITSLEVDGYAQAGVSGAYHVYADDPEGEQLWFRIDWGDGKASEGNGNTFTHAYGQQGSYELTASATDPQGASSQVTAEVNVLPAPAPICSGYPSLRVGENMVVGNYSITFDGTSAATIDNDHPGLFRLYHGPNLIKSGLKLGRNTTARITAANGDELEIDHCLSYGGFTLETNLARVRLSVNGNSGSRNLPPVITGIIGPFSIDAGMLGSWSISAYDPDGAYLSYGVNWGDDEGTRAADDGFVSTAVFQHTYSQPGNYTIVFAAKDREGAQAQASMAVAVYGNLSSEETPPAPPNIEQMPHGAKPMPAPAQSASEMDAATVVGKSVNATYAQMPIPMQPPSVQTAQFDRILELLEELRQMLQQVLGKI